MKNSIIKNFQDWNRIMEEVAPAQIPGVGDTPIMPAQPAPSPTKLEPITSKDGSLTKDDIKKIQSIVYKVPITDPVCDGYIGVNTAQKIKDFRMAQNPQIIIDVPAEPTAVAIGNQTLTAVKNAITGSNSPQTAAPAGTWPDRKPEDDKIAEKICAEIVAKFGDPAFWKPFKDPFNDREDQAGVAYDQWYTSTIDPQIKTLRAGDPNIEFIKKANDTIKLKLQGNLIDDEHTWSIETLSGQKQYMVDTDF